MVDPASDADVNKIHGLLAICQVVAEVSIGSLAAVTLLLGHQDEKQAEDEEDGEPETVQAEQSHMGDVAEQRQKPMGGQV